MAEPKVDKQEFEEVLATYRRLYQRTRSEAEQSMGNIRLPEVQERDDVEVGACSTGLDWSDPERS